ncbi:MAG: hypothetical protein ACTHU0_21470 [Kofleriaceae bacterium]
MDEHDGCDVEPEPYNGELEEFGRREVDEDQAAEDADYNEYDDAAYGN